MDECEYGLSGRVPVMIQHIDNGSGPQAPHVWEMPIGFISIKTKASRTGLNLLCVLYLLLLKQGVQPTRLSKNCQKIQLQLFRNSNVVASSVPYALILIAKWERRGFWFEEAYTLKGLNCKVLWQFECILGASLTDGIEKKRKELLEISRPCHTMEFCVS